MTELQEEVIPRQPWPVPDSWAWTTMGEVTDVVGGGTPSTKDTSNYDNGEVAWITPADLSGYAEKTIQRGARNITHKGLAGSGARLMPPGTVLFSSRAPIGYVAIAAGPVATNQGFKSFVLRGEILPDYVYYWLKRAKGFAIDLASGTTFLEVSGAKAAQIPFVLAPLPEQHRIVAAIETHITRLDAAVAALQRTRANLKRYRAAVLKAAVEGRLVSTDASDAGRKNDEADGTYPRNGMPLLQLENVLAQPLSNGRSVPDKAAGFPVLRLTALRSGLVDLSQRKQGAWTRDEAEPFLVRQGDFLVARGNGSLSLVGRGGLVVEKPDEVAYPDTLIRVRTDPGRVDPQYLRYIWDSETVRTQIESTARTTAGIYKINQQDLRRLALPLPPLPEQLLISREIERRFSILDQLEMVVEHSLKRSERLRQAILKRAFEGTLVPQDPTDEPASGLLERLRSERDSAPKANRVVGGTRMKKTKPPVQQRSIFEVLGEFPAGLSPESLYSESGHSSETVDQFFAELKREVTDGRVVEERSDTTTRILRRTGQ